MRGRLGISPPRRNGGSVPENDAGRNGSDSTSYALALVRKIDAYAIDLCGTVSVHQFDERAADYDDGLAVMTGLRLSF